MDDCEVGRKIGELVSENEANRRLFEAAPALLEALWAILAWDLDNVLPDELFKRAQAAIAKAHG